MYMCLFLVPFYLRLFPDVFQMWEEGDTGRTPGGEELHQQVALCPGVHHVNVVHVTGVKHGPFKSKHVER
jgi:hypothetical protein